jgi:predicted DNA-binding protein (MmcQ/YjbR family)
MIRAASNEETLRKLRSICLSLPESSETASWGHPNFKAGKKTFAAFERVKGRASIAFRLDPDEVNRLLGRKEFFVTPYGRGQWVSLWADGRIVWRTVEDLVERSYRVVALKRMLIALEARAAESQVKGQKAKGKG